MAQSLSAALAVHSTAHSTPPPARARRAPSTTAIPKSLRSLRTGSGARAKRTGEEMLVAIRSLVDGVNLENVCLIVAGVPHAPSGTGVVRPGNTSSLVELPPEVANVKTSVYFELALGRQRIPLVTDELFVFSPGAVCVVTITDHTRAHSPSIEVEGAVARLVRAREAAARA